MIPMCRLRLHSLYRIYGPCCPLSPEKSLNLITHSLFSSLGPSDCMWQHRYRSTLTHQVMACCLTAPRHYLNQFWLIITMVLHHSLKGNNTENALESDHCNVIENHTFKIKALSPKKHWVKNHIAKFKKKCLGSKQLKQCIQTQQLMWYSLQWHHNWHDGISDH